VFNALVIKESVNEPSCVALMNQGIPSHYTWDVL
jgi:hypothetical protein